MPARNHITGLIFAGGQGKRFGAPKADLVFRGESLLMRTITTIESLVESVAVAAGEDQGLTIPKHIRLIRDREPGRGPVYALIAALQVCSPGLVVVVGCDMPWLSARLLRYEISLADGYDVVIPLADGHTQPLHAIYQTSAAARAEGLVRQGSLSFKALIAGLTTRWVPDREWRKFSPDGRSFLNVNTSADLAFAESLS